jgi:hypothetical protein
MEAQASGTKHRAKNPKLQIPNPKEAPISKLQNALVLSSLKLGIWCFFGAWSLGFGISRASAIDLRHKMPL